MKVKQLDWLEIPESNEKRHERGERYSAYVPRIGEYVIMQDGDLYVRHYHGNFRICSFPDILLYLNSFKQIAQQHYEKLILENIDD